MTSCTQKKQFVDQNRTFLQTSPLARVIIAIGQTSLRKKSKRQSFFIFTFSLSFFCFVLFSYLFLWVNLSIEQRNCSFPFLGFSSQVRGFRFLFLLLHTCEIWISHGALRKLVINLFGKLSRSMFLHPVWLFFYAKVSSFQLWISYIISEYPKLLTFQLF